MSGTTTISKRDDIPVAHTWDLSILFPGEKAWEEELKEYEGMIPQVEKFKGTLGTSAQNLKKCLDFMNKIEILEERLGHYAFLRTAEDAGNSDQQGRFARFMAISSKAHAAASYQTPEIQAIPDNTMEEFLKSDSLADFEIALRKILHFKPHVLSADEERLLALQAESAQTPTKAFGALTDVDLDFGTIDTPLGPKPLSQSTFSTFLIDPDREIRRKAFEQFYQQFESHKNTLANLYAGSVNYDIYLSRVRGYENARSMALYPDKVPDEVYDNLIKVIHDNLPTLHKYYALRKKILGVEELRHYDVYVPLVKDVRIRHTFAEAVEVIVKALEPLGQEYTDTLKEGLLGRWVDRYENKGKHSGAFSYGTFTSDPYILMNYKDEVLRDLFTLAHEGGHSMHSWFSSRNNPFQHYHYAIFEAEVASTFNEQLLAKFLLDNAESEEVQAYLIGKLVDDIIATIFRQTMFAEFEHKTHSMVEDGGALTVDSLRKEYRKLLERYFGPEMKLEEVSDLEGLRIPHFYRSFYVYKYATGLSASIALAEKVMEGGDKEREEYFAFLKSGGSRYPLESLKLAGVDMGTTGPVQAAMDRFKELVEQLEELL